MSGAGEYRPTVAPEIFESALREVQAGGSLGDVIARAEQRLRRLRRHAQLFRHPRARVFILPDRLTVFHPREAA